MAASDSSTSVTSSVLVTGVVEEEISIDGELDSLVSWAIMSSSCELIST